MNNEGTSIKRLNLSALNPNISGQLTDHPLNAPNGETVYVTWQALLALVLDGERDVALQLTD